MAGPGFLNLFMTDGWYLDALAGVLEAGDRFGAGTAETPEHVNVEFVSANPTGPITVASARHGVYGDSLCRILEYAGHRVEREYYVNDAGGQVRRFGESIRARARGEEPPEDGYHGDYVAELAAAIEGAADMDVEELAQRGIELILEGVRASLARLRVQMDRYSLEHELHDQRGRGDRRGSTACTSPTAPPGCAPPRTATTRTGCSGAPPGSSPTSRWTSPTTPTSSPAATTG